MKTEHTKGIWSVGKANPAKSEITIWCDHEETNTVAAYRSLIGFVSTADVDTDEEALANATIICKSVNAYPSLIQTLKDLQEVLIEAKLTIHAKGIDVLLKKYE